MTTSLGLRRVSSNPVAALTLQRMAARAFLPEALEASEALAQWAQDNPGHLAPPRSVGKADASGRRLRPTDAWLVRRSCAARACGAPRAAH